MVVAKSRKRVKALILCYLARDSLLDLVTHLEDVQLIAKHTAESYLVAIVKRLKISVGVGNVAGHSCGRVSHHCRRLNIGAVVRVGVVARPYLNSVLHHTNIVSSAAARAGLDDRIGKTLSEPREKLIYALHISEVHLALSFGSKHRRADVAHVSVHIPLEVVYIDSLKCLVKHRHKIFNDLVVCHIKHELMA